MMPNLSSKAIISISLLITIVLGITISLGFLYKKYMMPRESDEILGITSVFSQNEPKAPDPSTITLFSSQRKYLIAEYMRSTDAKRLIEARINSANKNLSFVPKPIQYIQLEGKLPTDQAYITTQRSMQDIPKLYDISFAYYMTQDQKYLKKATEVLLAWATTNKPTGNPINETFLQPAFESYDFVMNDLAENDRKIIENWLRTISDREAKYKLQGLTAKNNWNSHRVKVLGLIAFVLNDQKRIDYAVQEYKKQITINLNADGTSFDLLQRDAMDYHAFDLEPLLTFAKVAKQNGVDVFGYTASSGATLKKSMVFFIPYVEGRKEHSEYIGSSVEFDRIRANSGAKEFAIGKKFDPKRGINPMEIYSYFDSGVVPIIKKVSQTTGEYSSLNLLLTTVAKK